MPQQSTTTDHATTDRRTGTLSRTDAGGAGAPVDLLTPPTGLDVGVASPAPAAPSPLRPEVAPSQGADRRATHWSASYRHRVLATDLAVLLLVVGIGALASPRRGEGPAEVAIGVGLGLVWLLALQLFRTRSPRRMAVGAEEYKRVVNATAATAGVACAAAVLLGPVAFAAVRPHLVLTVPVGLLALLLGRWSWRSWLHTLRLRGAALSDVVVVGEQSDVAYVTRQIARRSAVCYRVVGVVLDTDRPPADPATPGAPQPAAPLAPPGATAPPTYYGTERVPQAVTEFGADAVIVAGPLSGGTRAIRTLGWALEPTRTELVLVSSLLDVAGPRITMRPVEGLPLMHVDRPRFEGGRHVVKRALDIVGSTAALLLMLPLFAVIAILVRRDSPGGAFFTQTRTGRHGRAFRMNKFRTMVTTAEADRAALAARNEGAGPLFKLKDDPRVTRLGAVLRRHSLDELPQFWNVLRGDMSLVGPRPPLPEEVAAYEGHTGRRLYIKPGLTGLWQISGRSNLDWEESVRLDLYYVENWSVTGDLMIMWRTFKVMVRPEGAY
ncbi:sugar transferase [Georgenia sp. Z1344]|uniref:sugar transferase n=1 Tax=Georgenia sp. Z1344 TaxID=3416706 RepID=UPI003CF512E0